MSKPVPEYLKDLRIDFPDVSNVFFRNDNCTQQLEYNNTGCGCCMMDAELKEADLDDIIGETRETLERLVELKKFMEKNKP